MQAIEMPRKRTRDTYRKVFDTRKRRVRGLWQRNGRFFANITVADDLGRKKSQFVPLSAATLEEARADYARVLTERSDNRLRPLGMVPTFAEYLHKAYLPALSASGKRPASVVKEKRQLEHWAGEIGHVRLNKLGPGHLDAVLVRLSKEKLSGRTANLYLIAVRNLIKAAARDRFCQRPLPFEGLGWRKWDRKSRNLVTPEEIDRLVSAAIAHLPKRGAELAAYLRFLQFSGTREREALAIRWADIDWDNSSVTIGSKGQSKNRCPRHLPMNPKLRALLVELAGRRIPDSDLLFPSPRRGDDTAAAGGSFRAALGKARMKAGLPGFGFHDLRHHFASFAVMGGADFSTLARWLGHKDGGALLAKTYAHVSESHERRLAERLNFGTPTLVLEAAGS
jgi:integrase